MRGKLMCMMIALFLVMGLAIPCSAAEERGAIRVSLTREEDRTYYGAVTLYRVGVPVSGGYRLGSGFGGGFVEAKDVQSTALIQWLAERVGTSDGYRVLDSWGCGEFRNLEKGLYLLVQTEPAEGFYPFVPFLVQIPSGEQWEILTFPKMEELPVELPRTGDGSGVQGYGIVMAVSGMGLMLLLKRRKRGVQDG